MTERNEEASPDDLVHLVALDGFTDLLHAPEDLLQSVERVGRGRAMQFQVALRQGRRDDHAVVVAGADRQGLQEGERLSLQRGVWTATAAPFSM